MPFMASCGLRSVLACSQAQVDGARVMRKVDWHVLPVLFCVMLLDATEKSNLSYGALQLTTDLHFSKRTYGFGAGAYGLLPHV